MDFNVWLAFVAACVIFSIAPGAGTITSISNSLNGGLKMANKGLLGLQMALLVHLLIVSVGLGALLASSAFAFVVIKYLGAAYLLYLGVTKFLSNSNLHLENSSSTAVVATSKLIRQGFVVNMMNPKSIIFLAAFLPQFINSEQAMALQYFILGATVLSIDTLVMLSYAVMANIAKPYLSSPQVMVMLNRVFGSLFITMGVTLARVER